MPDIALLINLSLVICLDGWSLGAPNFLQWFSKPFEEVKAPINAENFIPC